MASGDIVPIELGLTDGDFITLWAPRWREGDDEWEAFLGQDESLFGFEKVSELVAFVRTDTTNDLVEHPSWKVFSRLAAAELEPDEDHVFDLIGLAELAVEPPTAASVAELADTLEMVRTIGDVCDLVAIDKFFSGNPSLGNLAAGVRVFEGKQGLARWADIETAFARGWDNVLDAIDALMTTPDTPSAAVALAEAELAAAAENRVDEDDATGEVDDDIDEADDDADTDTDPTGRESRRRTIFSKLIFSEDETDSTEDEDDAEDDFEDPEHDQAGDGFWESVGIDPIKIIAPERTYFTLRCYLGEDPVFLGWRGKIAVFHSERALGRFLANHDEHALALVSTYDRVRNAAVDGSLEIEVTDDNTYMLLGIADDLAAGPDEVDAEQLELAVELFTDAADFAGDDSVTNALSGESRLGWYISYITEPDAGRLAPSPPYTDEANTWRRLEDEFLERLVK